MEVPRQSYFQSKKLVTVTRDPMRSRDQNKIKNVNHTRQLFSYETVLYRVTK